ncbi:potassium channel family protein [Dictyobacter arantiisoli]|uniref:Potassium channel domain-containing protein n=1 Tax=Dictyobacter arantiisoli TaxID=2014874 RepID=A0A5A5TBB2_9CHLR|nr:potassium channel family protein [Dictyobacter arantiisoli]GCF08647.1 hypothetical protein KDI_22110 [Dictyobacter arantiisoli]
MKIVAIIISIVLILFVLQDSFETIILPRRVTRRFKVSHLFYTSTWLLWSAPARKMRSGNRREVYLSYFGPLSLIVLLILWASVLVFSFGLLQWGLNSSITAPDKHITLASYLYLSGTTFITLGLGDVVPLTGSARLLTVLEAGMGFGFLALIIGYVPVIYQVFSRRELDVSLLDARAGSPPSASELLRRYCRDQGIAELLQFIQNWEVWSAQLLESHLSYPVLTYYRSQHEHQSWLAALATILDTCALLMVGLDGISAPTIRFTFAISRHAAVDLAQAYRIRPSNHKNNRLSSDDFLLLRERLGDVGLRFRQEEDAEQRLAELRRMYEPFLAALADHMLMTLPPWITTSSAPDDWQTSAWDHFAEWSPDKLEEVTHIIIEKHNKKTSLAQSSQYGYGQ